MFAWCVTPHTLSSRGVRTRPLATGFAMCELPVMTQLSESVARLKVKPAEFARRLGVSRGHGHDLLTGRRRPTPALALAIEREFSIPAHILNPEIAAARVPASAPALSGERLA